MTDSSTLYPSNLVLGLTSRETADLAKNVMTYCCFSNDDNIRSSERKWRTIINEKLNTAYSVADSQSFVNLTHRNLTKRPIMMRGWIGNWSYEGANEQKTLARSGILKICSRKILLYEQNPRSLHKGHFWEVFGWLKIFIFFDNPRKWPLNVVFYKKNLHNNIELTKNLTFETQFPIYSGVSRMTKFGHAVHSGPEKDKMILMMTITTCCFAYVICDLQHFSSNFSNYRARFSMPEYESFESLFFSWDMGPVHFIAVNTEAYYFLEFGIKPLSNQYAWLLNDLEAATQPEARKERPWIILYGHRPMYCSNADHDDCKRKGCLTRVGMPLMHWYAMEPLLDKYGVDLAVWAHEHSYERLWPIYNYAVHNGTLEAPYTNPKAPVHIITGSAGCNEIHDHFQNEQPDWSAFRSIDYGYTRLTVFNNTHLHLQQVSDDQEGDIIDDMWLVRDLHVSYSQLRN
ncbi:unnamed protein product, partial [Meganyctiphanes norvegica]